MRGPMRKSLEISGEDMRVLWQNMRTPTFTFVALLAMLGVIVLLGGFLPFSRAWIVEAGVATLMVVTVLLFSMEVLEEVPLMRVFAGLGFFWVAILVGITLIDYLTR